MQTIPRILTEANQIACHPTSTVDGPLLPRRIEINARLARSNSACRFRYSYTREWSNH